MEPRNTFVAGGRGLLSNKLVARFAGLSIRLTGHDHVVRSRSVGRDLTKFLDEAWLANLRVQCLFENGNVDGRLHPLGGRTDTRDQAGRPNVKWEAWVA